MYRQHQECRRPWQSVENGDQLSCSCGTNQIPKRCGARTAQGGMPESGVADHSRIEHRPRTHPKRTPIRLCKVKIKVSQWFPGPGERPSRRAYRGEARVAMVCNSSSAVEQPYTTAKSLLKKHYIDKETLNSLSIPKQQSRGMAGRTGRPNSNHIRKRQERLLVRDFLF